MYKIILLVLLFVGLAGCEKTKDVLGLNREVPDEFEIPSNRPLEMPPEFLLPMPKPGASRPQDLRMKQDLEEKFFGGSQDIQSTSQGEDDDIPTFKNPLPKKEPQAETLGARHVLYEAGTSSRQSGIKDLVNRESYENDDEAVAPTTFMQELSAMKKMAQKR